MFGFCRRLPGHKQYVNKKEKPLSTFKHETNLNPQYRVKRRPREVHQICLASLWFRFEAVMSILNDSLFLLKENN